MMFRPVVVVVGVLLTGCHSDTAPNLPDGAAPGVKVGVTQCRVIDGKADRRCTPGLANPAVTPDTIQATICKPGWTATIRPPTAYTNLLKSSQLKNFSEAGLPSDYREDHLIPLSAGGDPTDLRNLFPQPTPESKVKDRDEDQAHDDVCSGRKTLADAQAWIVARWTH